MFTKRDQICGELKLALKRWEELNDMLAQNQLIDHKEYSALWLKIETLGAQLDDIAAGKVA